MSFKVSVCPHEFYRKDKWEKFFKNLSQILGIELVFEEIPTFAEEIKKIEEEKFLLYYASPSTAYLLYKKGYHPLAKFKGQVDEFLIVGKLPLEEIIKKEFIRVATINQYYYILPLSAISYKLNISFYKIQMLLTNSHKETLEKVISDEADFGIIYREFLNLFEESKELKIYTEFTLNTSHFFMLNPKNLLKEEIKENLPKIEKKILKELGYEEIEVFEEVEIEKLEALSFISELKFELLRGKTFKDVLINSPYIGVLIYHDKYVFANPYMCNLLGYSLEEFLKLKPEEIHYFEKDREKIREIVRRRLQGEYFLQPYEEIILKTKDNKKVYAMAFSQTIFHEGKFGGLVFIIDKSKEKRYKRLYEILRKVNQILIEAYSEKEFFERICKTLVEEFELKMVWVGVPDYETKLIKPLYWAGEERGYLKEIKVSMEESKPEGRGPVGTSFRKDEVIIISDVETDERFLPWKEPALMRGYHSVAAIPLKIENRVSYIIALYADEPLFFEEENRELLKELKRDLEFGIYKIELLRKESILAESLRNLEEVVIVLNEKGKITFVNKKGCEILGLSEKEIYGKSIGNFNFKFKDEPLEKLFEIGIKDLLRIPVKLEKNGDVMWFDMKIIPISLPDGTFRYVIIAEDVSQILEFKDLLNKARYVDPITYLLNYEGFSERVNEILPYLSDYAFLILLDLCDFTYINANFGYEAGNFCLEEIGRRLSFLKNHVILSRPFTDSYALFFYNITEKKDLLEILEKLKNLISLPIKILNKEIEFLFNAGIAVFPDDGKNFEDLWEKASISLTEAKKKRKGAIEVYNQDISKKIKECFECEILIRRAFEENLFTFYYQPMFDLSKLKIVGLEALIRIKEKNGSIYLPSEFIEYLEESVYLSKFEDLTIESIKEKILKWGIPISLNVSLNSILNPNFVSKIIENFKDRELSQKLIIEITERVFAKDIKLLKEQVLKIKEQGIKIALDDFGKVYASFSYLKEIPFDILKIDKNFIKEMERGKKELSLIKTFIDIGHVFEMKVLAEGVETKEQLNYLDIMGCDYVQGFYLAKPMPEEEVEKFLSKE